MNRILQGRSVIVPGRGFRRAICQRFQQEATRVATSERNINGTDESLAMLDALVNGAAILLRTPTLGAMDQSLWDITTDPNIKGLLLCCKYAIPVLLTRGSGAIVGVVSMPTIQGIGHAVPNAVGRAGVFQLSEMAGSQYVAQGSPMHCVATGGSAEFEGPGYGANSNAISERRNGRFIGWAAPRRHIGLVARVDVGTGITRRSDYRSLPVTMPVNST